jgi:carbonic anhydrase
VFDDLLTANAAYCVRADRTDLPARAARGLAVVTCMDSRIDPFAMLGLRRGDAKVIRNAGGRVTEDALRSLVLAVNLLEVHRIAVIHHRGCAMAGITDQELRANLQRVTGAALGDHELRAMPDPAAALQADVQAIRDCPGVGDRVSVAGFVIDEIGGELDLAVP